MSSSALPVNYLFLKRFDLQLVRLGRLAERYCKDDPYTCLIRLRQYGDLLAQLTATKVELYKDAHENQVDLLGRARSPRLSVTCYG
ncbi:MAG: hypothetical protein DCF32_11260 [Leptolyngbya sp.]|nr:MAG: hypothetical protein DCF32_11260 [Leptolyngbya sp.]